MKISPNFQKFEEHYKNNKEQIVYTTLSSDIYTAVSVSLKFKDEDYCCLFESVEGGSNRSRYSFLVLSPDLIFKCQNKKSYISKSPNLDEFIKNDKDVISSLRKLIKDNQIDIPSPLPSMAMGLFGFAGYDIIQYVEPTVELNNADNINIPESIFIRPQIVIIFDSVTDNMHIVTATRQLEGNANDAYNDAVARLQNIVDKITANDKNTSQLDSKESLKIPEISSNTSKQKYFQMVDKAKEYIFAGDIFQVVPSQRFQMDFAYDAFTLYRKLRSTNPSPFSFFAKFSDFALVGSSPEIMVRLKDKKVTVRPIAGTRKRDADIKIDNQLADDLLNDEKELSEHLMLLDLGRNDIGKVAKIGSVEVSDKMSIERYSHVMHLVSNVTGDIDDDKDALDAFLAGFPAGTVSGAPKIRAMQIIDELEVNKRSFYAGSVGYFSGNGDMDSCITLRTGLVKDNKLYVQAGGGVVAQSDAEFEYQETINKAQAVLNAAKLVYQGSSK